MVCVALWCWVNRCAADEREAHSCWGERGGVCESGAGDSEEYLVPQVRVVQGDAFACAESATVTFEYETWHVDPAAKGYRVQISSFPLPLPLQSFSNECADNTTNAAHVPEDGVPFYSTPEYIASARKHHTGKTGHVLTEWGILPGWGLQLTRLNAGLYWIKLNLLLRNVTVAEGGAAVRIMPGHGSCLRRSMATEYCDHTAVLDVLRALDMDAQGDGNGAPSLQDGSRLQEHIEMQTLEAYGQGFGDLLERTDAFVRRNGGRPPFFVEIGANDGKFADPLYSAVVAKRWHGLLVEPAHYRGHPHVSLEQAAVVDEHDDNQTLNITRVPLAEVYAMEQECIGRPDAEMCRYAIGVGTLRPDDKSHWILKDKGVQEAVRGISLAALLRKHSVSDIDILQVDTEGYDGRILRQLDLAKYRPLLVQFECDHLGVPELADVMLRFARHGYRMRTFGGDLVAFLPELLLSAPGPG